MRNTFSKSYFRIYLIFSAIFLMTVNPLSSYEWPIEEITETSFNTYFGQNRGGIISSSITFSEPSEIKATENGYIIAILTEQGDDSDFFPSTLGTSVILSHEDDMISVYGNIDTESLPFKSNSKKTVAAGQLLGSTGDTGWQENQGYLEFQIIDRKNSSAINPKVLMPRAEKEIPLVLTGITLQSKDKNLYDLNNYRTFPSGLYKVYQKRNTVSCPYKTSVSINGIIADQLSFDTVISENGQNCIIGKKKYTSADLYPNDSLQLLGEAMFTPGRVTLLLSVQDFLGNNRQLTYNINIY